MYTGLVIGLLVIAGSLSALGTSLTAAAVLGWRRGTTLSMAGAVTLALLYRIAVRPWHLRWGATDEEITRPMPGDDLLPGAESATRAITIEAPPEDVWPWLIQLGYGRAGWYSYDWIDNDFQPSADHIVPELQHLEVGDRILMMPTMGFEVRAVHPPHSIVSLLEDGSTSWCLALYPAEHGSTRLVSRWRPRFERSVATFLLNLLVEPGTFIMEQKMLRTIRDRVEAVAR